MSRTRPDAVWYYSSDGLFDHGPFSKKELQALAANGTLRPAHWVWREGDPGRVCAREEPWLLFPNGSPRPKPKPEPEPDWSERPEPLAYSNPHDVFISYSTNDKPIADAICARLERERVRCWIAPRDVFPGKNWGEAIVDGISESRLMVVVLSAASNGSPQVLREVERAVSKGLPIIPFRIEKVVPSKSMEYFLSAPHWLDALTKPLEAHLDRLTDVVGAVLRPGEGPIGPDRPRPPGPGGSLHSGLFAPLFAPLRGLASLFSGLAARSPQRFVVGLILAFGLALLVSSALVVARPSKLESEYRRYLAHLSNGHGSKPLFLELGPLRLDEWRDAAENGDPIAQLFVGRCYQEGIGVKEDVPTALVWLHKSEKQGNTYAAMTIGNAYDIGKGIPKDRPSAETWYRKAAKEGNPQAMLNLGVLYSSDNDSARKEEAFQWFKKAAAAGFPVGMRRVAACYAYGTGVPKDRKESDRWYRQAADAGDGYSAGALFAKKIETEFQTYADPDKSAAAKETALAHAKQLMSEFKTLELDAVSSVFSHSNISVAVEKVREASASDPLLQLHREMLDFFMMVFKKGNLDDRLFHADTYSMATDLLVSEWYKEGRNDDVASFWEASYRDFPITTQNYSDMQPFIHQMSEAVCSLFRTGKRKEARLLLADALALCDVILGERPWDWYVKDAYSGLCFETAAILTELGDADEAQPLLKRAWNVRVKQFGKDDLLKRITQFPLKGKVPAGASTEDTKFFKGFASDAPKEESSMKRFTIPCDFDGTKFPFHVYVMRGPRGYAELQDQFRWVTECRGGTVPQEVRDSFLRLNKIAAENNVDFMELSVYALSTDSKPAKK